MKPDEIRPADGVNDRVKRLEEYLETLNRLFPKLSENLIHNPSVSGPDSLALGYFLECFRQEILALVVGDPLEISAFYLATHPQVRQVVRAGPDREPADIAADARAALAEFPAEQKKITCQKDAEIPTLEPNGTWPVVFVNGDKKRESVRDNLSAVFAKNPQAIAVVSGCRRDDGPFVQAGVVDFMEGSSEEYRFRLLGDLSPGLAAVGLGVLYTEEQAAETEEVLDRLGSTVSRTLDPLSLLRQKEELVATVSGLRQNLKEATKQGRGASQLKQHNYTLQQQNANLKKKVSNLKQNNSRLTAHYSSRRYRLVDVLVGGIRRLLTAGRRLRRGNK